MARRSPTHALTLAIALLAACGQSQPPPSREANDSAAAEAPADASAPRPSEAPLPEKATDSVAEPVSECAKQNGERIPDIRLKAIGTEPFWGARIEGRCVTYSTPEDQDGTRIWTRFEGSADTGSWTGYLDDKRFILRTRPQPGCSDGMSDNRYPIAVELTARGEERTGCASPL